VRGVVQGVGFRPWVLRAARGLGLAGRVWNDGTGATIEAFGEGRALGELVRRVRRPALPGAAVEAVAVRAIEAEPVASFSIAESRFAGAGRLPLAPDLASCPECLAEARDPADRRHRHPFAACARCGPRFTIATALPWDRPRTTLAPFPPCAACRAEYEDPDDRRLHAEAIACPRCGPTLVALDRAGRRVAGEEAALARAAALLRAGGIVALQGLGGFHLACDATRAAVVDRLRARKRRERKPFAVMVRDLSEAGRVARLEPGERALLASPARPIVLCRRRRGAPLAPGVAPGLDRVGLLLPYTTLHMLLLDDVGAPLVVTSGNLSGDPIAHRVEDALARLRDAADLFLAHDRAIAGPCDDSVAIWAAGAPVWLRRSRGMVPRPLPLPRPVREPVLACGGQASSTFCVAVGGEAFLSAHCGDLDGPDALAAYEEAIARLLRLLGVGPRVVAHDLHPGYESTRFALALPARRRVAVQHHHAHLAGALADHGLVGPALGLLWDGTGLGHDGSAWGGELLVGGCAGFERLATLRPLRLAGGEAAIREPWRAALALLEDAFEGAAPLERLALFRRVDPARLDAVRALVRSGVACVTAHGVGRLFDAMGALALGQPRAGYAGELALAWNAAARGARGEPYPVELDRSRRPWQLDLRPMVRAAVAELLAGRAPGAVSARFHETLAAGAARLVEAAQEEGHRALPIALGGGCFQNALLLERVLARLSTRGRVLRPRALPPGDGGLALGQALVADARVRAEPAPCA
jgi:hydrogenase maturation protein HypF